MSTISATTTAPPSNGSLSSARKAKNDEFYTRIEDIENELRHYKDHFRDKVVFLNCDDPVESNFWRYFELNFDHLGIRKLISTHYDPHQPTYKLEIIRGTDLNGDGHHNSHDIVRTPLLGNGDFRSPEAIDLLREADIVVTNPPFSLFREYINLLTGFDKKFLVLGNMNAITYKETWPLIQGGEMWLGVSRTGTGQMWFRVPDGSPEKTGQKILDGVLYQTVGSSAWFTNLDHARRHEEIVLFRRYDDDPSLYPTYANYDAIEVSKVADIPVDYDGEMGVPITFLGRHNPDQFEIVGQSRMLARENPTQVSGKVAKDFVYVDLSGATVYPYMRVVIRRKQAAA